MISNKKVNAIVPARSGSKGIINKNIKLFCGIPLIAHTIKQAQKSKYIDDIIITSDCEKIHKISKEYGDLITIKRPDNLANDKASNIDVVLHAINMIKSDIFVLLQPTSPLRLTDDIDNSLKLLIENNSKIAVSVCEIKNYQYSFSITEKNYIDKINNSDLCSTNRQEYSKNYTINGSIYISYNDHFIENKFFIKKGAVVHKMPIDRSIDIDEIEDWELAEKLFNKN